jgi:hypothetical protein
MTEKQGEDRQALLAPMSLRQLVLVVLVGAVAGIIAWGLSYVLDTYVLQAIFCREESADCSEVPQYAEAIAGIIAAGAALFGLVKLRAMRPLVVVVAATLALWGLVSAVVTLEWYGALLAVTGLYALTYAIFAWIARLRVLWMVMFLVVAALVAIRFGLNG